MEKGSFIQPLSDSTQLRVSVPECSVLCTDNYRDSYSATSAVITAAGNCCLLPFTAHRNMEYIESVNMHQ